MPPTIQHLGIDRLSVDERLTLVQDIWDGIAAEPDQVPLSEAQERELSRRLAAHEADPGAAIPWETARDATLARLRR